MKTTSSTHDGLTPGQHARLEAELRAQRDRLAQALSQQLGGQDRVAHAQELLGQDARDSREHEADRELDQGRSEHLISELRDIDGALARLAQPGYGLCADCGAAIPFDRLLQQPQALCCVGCQSTRERRAHH
jgi:RNA polymerase-binding transcription factor DksA